MSLPIELCWHILFCLHNFKIQIWIRGTKNRCPSVELCWHIMFCPNDFNIQIWKRGHVIDVLQFYFVDICFVRIISKFKNEKGGHKILFCLNNFKIPRCRIYQCLYSIGGRTLEEKTIIFMRKVKHCFVSENPGVK